ncbi:MAG: hypothetical protein ACAI44_16335 [Candidatus Sericytochromatia bacterium]
MLTKPTRTRIKSRLGAWLGLLIVTPLVAVPALMALYMEQTSEQTQGPPPMAAAVVHSQLPALHGQLLSLKYIEPLNSYRVSLRSPQGQILSFEQEARSGRLLGLKTQPVAAGQLPEDLLPLETLLQKLFGKADFQLLAVELNTSTPEMSYTLDWIQDGTSFHAHFDARNGALLGHTEA